MYSAMKNKISLLLLLQNIKYINNHLLLAPKSPCFYSDRKNTHKLSKYRFVRFGYVHIVMYFSINFMQSRPVHIRFTVFHSPASFVKYYVLYMYLAVKDVSLDNRFRDQERLKPDDFLVYGVLEPFAS